MYNNRINKKIFHIVMLIVIIFIILFIAGILLLQYQVEGESNMPFQISKISIIGSVEGIETEQSTDKWNFNVNQNNDIYIYIEKNSGYGKTEIIDTVEIKDIKIDKKNTKGEIKLYKPVIEEKRMFVNEQENEINQIEYKGDLKSDIKEQKISNQGGIVAFRYAINNLSQYISDKDEQVDHSKLLQLTNIEQEDLQTNLQFKIVIKLTSGKKYEANVNIEIPTDEIIDKGTIGVEITNLENIIFKRVEN